MPQKERIASAALLCIIIVFTILVAHVQSAPALIGSFAQFLLPAILTIYLLLLLYSARIIMDFLASFFLGKKHEGDRSVKSWMAVIGYTLGTIAIILLLRSAAFHNIMGMVQSIVAVTSSVLKIGQASAHASAAETSPYLFYYVLIVFVAIVLVSFTLLIGGAHTAYRWTREERSLLTGDKIRFETLQVVQRTAKNLRLTDDYRATILDCYREMCRVLSLHGFKTEFYETASEFSKSISDKLGLERESVKGLTLLFEEARYSNHRIDNAKRTEALNQLETLERSLSVVGR